MKRPPYSPQVGVIRALLLGVFLGISVAYVGLGLVVVLVQ